MSDHTLATIKQRQADHLRYLSNSVADVVRLTRELEQQAQEFNAATYSCQTAHTVRTLQSRLNDAAQVLAVLDVLRESQR